MSITQSIIDSINKATYYKTPRRIRVTSESYLLLMKDERVAHINISGMDVMPKLNSLPIVIDNTIKKAYEFDY